MNSTASPDQRPALLTSDEVRHRLKEFAASRRLSEVARRSGVVRQALHHLTKGGPITLDVVHRIWPVMDAMDEAVKHLDAVAPTLGAARPEPPSAGRTSPSVS